MSVGAMVAKEFRQIVRDRRTLGLIVFLPMFLLIMFGYAVNLDVRHARLAVLDLDRSSLSRRLIASFQNNPEYFDLTMYAESPSEIDAALRGGIVQGAIVIPRGFSRDIIGTKSATVNVVVDGTNGTTAAALQGYIESVVLAFGNSLNVHRRGDTDIIQFQPRVWYNPSLESNQFLIPGLAAFILVITAVISTALSIVKEKELGTMEQLIASPISPGAVILGKMIPYVLLSIVIATGIFLSGYLLFGVAVAGSVFYLAVVTLLFLFGSLGLGILISSLVETQQVAFLISILATLLPVFILSGFIFPIENMPRIIQFVTAIVPARYYISSLRAIMLKGAGAEGATSLEMIYRESAYLFLFAVITMSVGVLRLRRRFLS